MVKRKTLRNGRGIRKPIDMLAVYKALDTGRSVQSVAEEWGVSPATLHRRHREYQRELNRMLMEEYPPLPEDVEDPAYPEI